MHVGLFCTCGPLVSSSTLCQIHLQDSQYLQLITYLVTYIGTYQLTGGDVCIDRGLVPKDHQ